MNTREKAVLFDGYNGVLMHSKNDRDEWRGIIGNAIVHHKYYPDDTISAEIVAKKQLMPCIFCEGKLLEATYRDYMFCGLSYSEWLTSPISEIMKKVTRNKNKHLHRILETFKCLGQLGLGNIRLIDSLNEFDSTTRAIIKLVSLFKNNIWGTVIVMQNMENLHRDQYKIVEEILVDWSQNNTVVICV